MRVLVIGGTRNLGPSIVSALVEDGHRVSIFHRGVTNGPLPVAVERLLGDRSDPAALAAACDGREFDAVIDTTLYDGPDAEAAGRIFAGRTGRYVMLSTGQVYLVRLGLERPFREADYEGPLMDPPPAGDHFEHKNWAYGFHKRAAEEALAASGLPVTILRLPMVNSERDHFDRIFGYLARLADGGAILVPEGPHLALRHVYGGDVVRAIQQALRADGNGAYNIGQDETVAIDDFLAMLARCAGAELRIRRLPRTQLAELLPACSPFSDPWMSALDNTLSKTALGMSYTPLDVYLPRLVAHYAGQARLPVRYEQRPAELRLGATSSP